MTLILTALKIEDKILKSNTLYALWMSIWITILTVLSVDDTTGPSRDFTLFAMGTATIYPFAHIYNKIYGNGLTSTWKMIATSLHQFLFWILFTYFKPSEVVGSHPIGVMNWIWVFITIPFIVSPTSIFISDVSDIIIFTPSFRNSSRCSDRISNSVSIVGTIKVIELAAHVCFKKLMYSLLVTLGARK